MARPTCECACRLERREDARPTSVDEDPPPVINLVPMELADPEGVLLQPSPGAGEPPLVSQCASPLPGAGEVLLALLHLGAQTFESLPEHLLDLRGHLPFLLLDMMGHCLH
jgi:hypothetical protein